ncbi:amidohydrolase [Rathayibacter sp. VKM Ac-2805]|uniref:amidohydrolase n=1 Tax=Rathayibacter sp. VKM Ac-2805 TaxID=2609258 RepID=UPI00132040D5|nr:amidohydrolase [Rathayibacter sp. VKM Ac-2805]QHC75109.1 amidohydrolase family protein [Rathayibacter sp. VKM Ac-2805]
MSAPDLVLIADAIITLDPATPDAQALAVADGVVVAVGSADEMRRLADADTRVETVDGVLTPGLTDSHTHVVWGLELTRGEQLTDLDLSTVRSRVKAAAEASAEGAWVHGWGLDPNLFTDTGFIGRAFDDVTGDVPMFLRMRDGHSAMVNSAAIRAAGLTGAESFPDESRIGVADDGAPSGYVLEIRAMDLVLSHAPEESLDVMAVRLRELLSDMAASGIVTTYVMDYHRSTPPLMEMLEGEGDLPVRLKFSPFVYPGASAADFEEIRGLQGTGGRRWQVEGAKFFIDGTIDNGSAWLDRPDAYGQGTKSIWSDPDAYREALAFFVHNGIPTATHAIGDRGVAFVLDAFEALGPEVAAGAHRIEHIETIPDEVVPRFAQLGVIVSMQPTAGTHHTRADLTDNWSTRLGPERAGHGWRCRDLHDAGAVIALGSDWPIVPFDPRVVMADTILRRPVERPEVEPIRAEQALSPLEALEGYTVNAARAAGWQDRAGTIAAGRRADFTAWRTNPLSTAPELLPDIAIVATWIDGERVK